MNPRALLRSLGLGRLAYRVLHRPFSRHPDREAAMRREATRLNVPDLPPAPASWPAALFLTGRNFWHQTLFCADSFERTAGVRLPWKFYDDGSLDAAGRNALTRRFAGASIVSAEESSLRTVARLPPARFPSLHAARAQCPLMKKLMDLRAGRAGPSLYLDSDMLFFSRPDALLGWMRAPRGNHYMQDALDSYALPVETVSSLAGHPVLPKVNAGLLAFDDTPLDWDALESFAAKAGPDIAAHRLFEQTLTAVHATRVGATPVPASDYRLLHEPVIAPPHGVLLHYCWHAKDAYFQSEWLRCREKLREPRFAQVSSGPHSAPSPK